nr:PREDICTED: uncharacterized protein LOC104220260 isoform X2 [Nicotiana sylvestris]
MDTGMNPFILMLWEDFADVDGSTLAAQVAEYPVIVAKRITRTTYGGMEKITLFSLLQEICSELFTNIMCHIRLSLSTRYNSVILINPPYPQVGRLQNW